MIQRFHGLDRHKKHSTISVLNRKGQEVEFFSKCLCDLSETAHHRTRDYAFDCFGFLSRRGGNQTIQNSDFDIR